MSAPYRFAICNELFQKVPLSETCARARALGYEGLEIAPFTLAENPTSISAEKRTEICQTIADADLQFVGLHWLLVSPEGLHCTTRDEAVRRRTWDHVHHLIDLCADLSGCSSEHSGVLVFGSPKQRSTVDGMTPREATDVFTHELAHTAPHAESRGVTILVEALPANQSDVVNCLGDAVAIVKQIGSPAIQTMFDTHNAVDEKDSHASLVRRYFQYIRHVHVNELDGREPGMGDYDFAALLSALSELNYSGWVSLEAFDLSRDAEEVARRAMAALQSATRTSALVQTA